MTMEMYHYLAQYKEELPEWLSSYKEGDELKFEDVISSRLAYYPGFGDDGSMLMIGNRSHAIHSFIHTDYLNEYRTDIRQLNNIAGYHSIAHFEWSKDQIFPTGKKPHGIEFKTMLPAKTFLRKGRHHYITEILERNPEKDESWGSKRIAVTVLTEDGIDFYFQLFINRLKRAPFLFLLQDHGFGCNYDRFGKGGLLDIMISQGKLWPDFVICDKDKGTTIWDGYKKINEVEPVIGGMHGNKRLLWKRDLTDHSTTLIS